MLGGADNPNGELLSYIIGADTTFVTKIYALDLQMNNHPYKLNFNSLRH